MSRKVGTLVAELAVIVIAMIVVPGAYTGIASSAPRPRIEIAVTDLGTGAAIRNHAALASQTTFQVTVSTTGNDCAGQFVVTALGAPGAPPSVLVTSGQFILGPAAGQNSVSSQALDSGQQNDWKISASCNGGTKNEFDFASFEFFVNVAGVQPPFRGHDDTSWKGQPWPAGRDD